MATVTANVAIVIATVVVASPANRVTSPKASKTV
jgi:hypothetical protein